MLDATITDVENKQIESDDEVKEARERVCEILDRSDQFVVLAIDPENQRDGQPNETSLTVCALVSGRTAPHFLEGLQSTWERVARDYPEAALMLLMEAAVEKGLLSSEPKELM